MRQVIDMELLGQVRELVDALLAAGSTDIDGRDHVPVSNELRDALDGCAQLALRLDIVLREGGEVRIDRSGYQLHRTVGVPEIEGYIRHRTDGAEAVGRGGSREWMRQQAEGVAPGEAPIIRERRKMLPIAIAVGDRRATLPTLADAPFSDGRIGVVCSPAQAEGALLLARALSALDVWPALGEADPGPPAQPQGEQ